MAQGKQQISVKEIHVIGPEIIDATYGQRTTEKFRFHELC